MPPQGCKFLVQFNKKTKYAAVTPGCFLVFFSSVAAQGNYGTAAPGTTNILCTLNLCVCLVQKFTDS